MLDIERRLQPAVPHMRIYPGRVVFSASACSLLGLADGHRRVFVRQDMHEAENGRTRVYVCRTDKVTGYVVMPRGKGGRINSATLARKLADMLDGYGSYRICEEVTVQDGETVYYEVFFRRYD